MKNRLVKLLNLLIIFHLPLVMLSSQTLSEVGHYGKNDVSDVVLIYCGDSKRLKWVEDDFMPYVTHTFLDGHKTWLFQGFVFLELSLNKHYFLHKKNSVQYGTRDDWKALINKAFEENRAFDALNTTIEKQKRELGNPPFRHKVIYGIPTPIKNQKDWGNIGRKSLDFSTNADRVQAAKWYVDEFMATYKKHSYNNLDFDGFYWTEEDMEQVSSKIMHEVADYIHQKYHVKFYWMPYLRANGSTTWQKGGFDYAYTQSGYSIKKSYGIDRVKKMCKKAKERGMGIVIEFDGGLFANPDMFVPRLNETIDELEIQGVYEAQTALAYYEGGRLVRDIHYGKHKSYKPTREQLLSIKKIMDRIAQHIVDRHPKTYKSTGDYQQPPNNKSNNSTNSSYDWRNPDYWHF